MSLDDAERAFAPRLMELAGLGARVAFDFGEAGVLTVDGRAVPPLVYKMNRFKFEYRVQMPAHRALMEMGWYGVPALIARLDNRAAGIWISWTLRKISGETMGTDKRKWDNWWKSEKLMHPELFEDDDEQEPEGSARPRRVGWTLT